MQDTSHIMARNSAIPYVHIHDNYEISLKSYADMLFIVTTANGSTAVWRWVGGTVMIHTYWLMA